MPQQNQAALSAGRTYLIGTAAHASAPVDGTTEPDMVLSPVGPAGMPTFGFLLGLKAPAAGSATAGGGGFSVTVWLRDPVRRTWFSFASVSIDYSELFGTSDIDSGEVYFQIGNASVAGNVYLTVWEQ